jgi:lipoprotein-anchoring transpeptidase ErfK/SrfK
MHSKLLLAVTLLALAGCVPIPQASSPPSPEANHPAGRWIEVVLEEQMVYLREGDAVVAALPASCGVGDRPETTTYPGEYAVAAKYRGPEQTAPGVFVRDIVIFDWEHGNGFHSLPMDADGRVLDPTVGAPASAGCVRVSESAAVYDFATLGMKVLVR